MSGADRVELIGLALVSPQRASRLRGIHDTTAATRHSKAKRDSV